MLLGLFVSACSTHHEIKIPKPPCLYPLKRYDFILCRNFNFVVNEAYYSIPQGFTTDLASVPRILWSIYSPSRAETIPGAIIHDYFYFCPQDMNRMEADSIFYDALVLQGLSKGTAFKYWLGVRLFGQSHFNQGAICHHGYTRTENTIGHLRVAYKTIP